MKDILSLMNFNPFTPITHDSLAALMPFYCCWLDDGDGKPCTASVALGPMIYSTNAVCWGGDVAKLWKN
jgi:hypothetical protein